MSMTLVVMAAGRGSRFGGMKQVAGLGPTGEALFDYAVYDAMQCGFEDVVLVVSEASAEAVEAHAESGCARHVKVRYALQEAEGRAKPFGTGHAVLTAAAEVAGAFGVVNADDFYGPRSFELLGRELGAAEHDHVLVAFRLRESLSPNGGVSRGVCRVENGVLASIRELHEVEEVDGSVRCREGVALTGDELISTNLWGFQRSFGRVLAEEFDRFLAEQGDDPDAEFLLGDGVMSLPRHGDARVRVVPTPEPFLGVTYAEDAPIVTQRIAGLVASGRYPTPLWQ
jgi:hypothetical protein